MAQPGCTSQQSESTDATGAYLGHTNAAHIICMLYADLFSECIICSCIQSMSLIVVVVLRASTSAGISYQAMSTVHMVHLHQRLPSPFPFHQPPFSGQDAIGLSRASHKPCLPA